MKRIELRRHALRDPDADRLSAEGRIQAEDLGRSLDHAYDAVFVSPVARAAETVAWVLRGAGQQLPEHHAAVPGLAGHDASGGSPEAMAAGMRALLDLLEDGEIALAVSHTPLVERAAFGLTGEEIEPLAECEGILIIQDGDAISVEELRASG